MTKLLLTFHDSVGQLLTTYSRQIGNGKRNVKFLKTFLGLEFISLYGKNSRLKW